MNGRGRGFPYNILIIFFGLFCAISVTTKITVVRGTKVQTRCYSLVRPLELRLCKHWAAHLAKDIPAGKRN